MAEHHPAARVRRAITGAIWTTTPNTTTAPSTRPYGTVWGYYPDEMHPTLRCTFQFIGSSFTLVLHMCLLCWRESAYRRGRRAPVSADELRVALASIDAAVGEAPY